MEYKLEFEKLCNEYSIISVWIHLLELILPTTSCIKEELKIAISEFVVRNQWSRENYLAI